MTVKFYANKIKTLLRAKKTAPEKLYRALRRIPLFRSHQYPKQSLPTPKTIHHREHV
jgi:hypothetical protein